MCPEWWNAKVGVTRLIHIDRAERNVNVSVTAVGASWCANSETNILTHRHLLHRACTSSRRARTERLNARTQCIDWSVECHTAARPPTDRPTDRPAHPRRRRLSCRTKQRSPQQPGEVPDDEMTIVCKRPSSTVLYSHRYATDTALIRPFVCTPSFVY